MPGSVASGRCARDRGARAGADRAVDNDSAASAISVGSVGSGGLRGPRPSVSRVPGRWRFVGAGGREGSPDGRSVSVFPWAGRPTDPDDRTMRDTPAEPSRQRPGVGEGASSPRRVGDGPAPGA